MRNKNISLSEIYHENSKLFPHVIKQKSFSDKELAEFMIDGKKEYLGSRRIKLVLNGKLNVSLEETLINRRSVREFKPGYIDFGQLSKILALSYGPSAKALFYKFEVQPYIYLFRTAPSAGALYACEVYILCHKVKGLNKGIYYFNSDKLQLELLRKGAWWEKFLNSLIDQPYAKDASCAIIISANFGKIKYKYGERGYRYVLLDAGHIGENIYLTATALNLAIVGICGFYDDKVNELLRIDGYSESVIYILVLGKKYQNKRGNYVFA